MAVAQWSAPLCDLAMLGTLASHFLEAFRKDMAHDIDLRPTQGLVQDLGVAVGVGLCELNYVKRH